MDLGLFFDLSGMMASKLTIPLSSAGTCLAMTAHSAVAPCLSPHAAEQTGKPQPPHLFGSSRPRPRRSCRRQTRHVCLPSSFGLAFADRASDSVSDFGRLIQHKIWFMKLKIHLRILLNSEFVTILFKMGGRVRWMVALQGPDTRGVSAKRTSPATTSLDARKILKLQVSLQTRPLKVAKLRRVARTLFCYSDILS